MQQTSPGSLLTALRADPPLVQNITNFVAMNIAANVLLAAGASPAMVHAEEEASEFAGIARALTINIGTLSAGWMKGMHSAADAANRAGKPWVLDPVAHYATNFRRQAVDALLAHRPTIIRGNASEIIALAGGTNRGQGVDSRDPVEQAQSSARILAKAHGAVVAATGEIDFVTDGERAFVIEGGSRFMPAVTALGCSLTCLVGALAAVFPTDPLVSSVAALTIFAVAGENAARQADGPGSFAWRFLDALSALDGPTLDRQARIRAA
ncbi:hydroxyethylthiazole kinase [Rhizobium oryzicola]|uniref:Hydroxyethylthiazole kinase n=1 Tax=Rhizobium oryzicola TaxID=1232668 RepID=A0ABT8T4J8_9HYPH|nr:hydroxyethylthiazole kinase [Rhizobium oryzicola]MDO1585410.1 hydroxyethylthiazole kinase [Rhizobium oryzicola]